MAPALNNFLIKEVSNKETPKRESNIKEVNIDDSHPKSLQDFSKGINWDMLVDATFQTYLKSGIGSLIVPTESMLKVYFLQYRYGMLASDIEKALIEIDGFREFALETDVVPSASSIRAFARLLKENKLSAKIEKSFTFEIMVA